MASGRAILGMKLDASGFNRRRLKMLARSRAAREDTLREIAGNALGQVVSMQWRDTNRLVRSYIQAGWDLGQAHRVGLMPPLVRSDNRRFASRLYSQRAYFKDAVKELEAKGLTGTKMHAKALKQAEKAAEQVRLYEHGEASGVSVLIIGRRKNKAGHLTGLTTVRHKLYGGRGLVKSFGHKSFVMVHSLEPHASIVESKNRLVRASFAGSDGGLLTRAKPVYRRALLAS